LFGKSKRGMRSLDARCVVLGIFRLRVCRLGHHLHHGRRSVSETFRTATMLFLGRDGMGLREGGVIDEMRLLMFRRSDTTRGRFRSWLDRADGP